MLRFDPAAANLVRLAANVHTSDLGPRTTEEGAGVPFAFCYDRGSPFLTNKTGVSRFGISLPVRLERSDVDVEGRKRPLAADFSAPIAIALSRSPNGRSTFLVLSLPGCICPMLGFIGFSSTTAIEFQ